MITVKINNKEVFVNSYNFSRSLNNIADGFSASTSPSFFAGINIGDKATLFYGNELIFTGFIDNKKKSINGNSINCQFGGRSKTADLVDCSIALNFENASLADVLARLSQDFSFNYSLDFVPNNEETIVFNSENVSDVISTLVRNNGRFLFALPNGDLAIKKLDLATIKGEINEGLQLVGGSVEFGESYSKFITFDLDGNEVILDNNQVKRYRPFTQLSDGKDSIQVCKKRLKIQKLMSDNFSVNLVTKEPFCEGKLFNLGSLYYLKLPSLDIYEILLLESLDISASLQNMSTSLNFCRKEKFNV